MRELCINLRTSCRKRDLSVISDRHITLPPALLDQEHMLEGCRPEQPGLFINSWWIELQSFEYAASTDLSSLQLGSTET